MHFVYILRSLKDGSCYTGVAENLNKRLSEHNNKNAQYSSSKAPFKIVWYGTFDNKNKALDFEKYLKTGSGIAFRNKRLV